MNPPISKKLLIKAEFGEVLSGTFNCCDERWECCNNFLINDQYTFKNVQITFKLKNRFTCHSFNLIYVVICGTCKEDYIGVYHEQIRQPQDPQLKVEGHLRVCGNGEIRVFLLL